MAFYGHEQKKLSNIGEWQSSLHEMHTNGKHSVHGFRFAEKLRPIFYHR